MGFFSGLILFLAVVVLILVSFAIGFLIGVGLVSYIVEEAVPDVLECIKEPKDTKDEMPVSYEEDDDSWME